MLLAIDVGNTETVIGLYDLGGDDAAVPPPTSASASPSRTSRPAGSPTAGDSRRSQPNPMSSPSCSPSCLTSRPRHRHLGQRHGRVLLGALGHRELRQMRHGGSPPSPAWCSARGAQRHADPLRQPERVGADRVANAVGAFELFGGPCIVVDLGTAPPSTPSPRSASTRRAITPGWPSAWRRSSSTRRPPPCRAGRPRGVIGVRPSSPSSRERSTASVPRWTASARASWRCSAPPRSSPPAPGTLISPFASSIQHVEPG